MFIRTQKGEFLAIESFVALKVDSTAVKGSIKESDWKNAAENVARPGRQVTLGTYDSAEKAAEVLEELVAAAEAGKGYRMP